MGQNDRNGGGRINRKEWRKRAAVFKKIDADGDGYLSLDELRARPTKIIPVGGIWVDPNALFRKKPPLDSYSMRALPQAEKKVPISVMVDDGELIPADTEIIWPHACSRKQFTIDIAPSMGVGWTAPWKGIPARPRPSAPTRQAWSALDFPRSRALTVSVVFAEDNYGFQG